MNLRRTLALAFGFLTVWHAPALLPRADEAAAKPQSQPAEEVSSQLYSRHVQPLFEEHCQACHSAESKQGGFDLSTPAALLRGGTRGVAIAPGNAKASLLYRLITHEQEPAMPFKAPKLSKEAIALVELWINLGAHVPESQAREETSTAASAPTAAGGGGLSERQFIEHARPVLQAQCFNCHGGKFKQAGLSLQSRETLLRGSDNGPVVVPGKADESLLVKKIRHEHEPGMPYKMAKLPEPDIAQIVNWVNAGVPYDRPLEVTVTAGQVTSLHHESSHWAFQPVKRPALPKVSNRAWVRNPIDAFVGAKRDEKKLMPVPAADKRVLIRRVYLDLIGLPPAPAEIQAFLADNSPNAYEKIVDRLLTSPRYGERWGRHWMDIWRYSDWYGYGSQVRNSQPHIWHWRDWIVESLNEDKGYDRMVQEMLAGDELAPTDLSTLRATGYLARTWYRFNRNVWLQDTVEHVSAGFLGVTLKCARCHDHKYDPLAQEEYYKFRAFFEPYDVRMDPAPGEADTTKDGIARSYDAPPREATGKDPLLPAIFAETYRFIRGDEKSPDKEHPLTPGVPEALGGRLQIQPIQLPIEAAFPVLRTYVQNDLRKQAKQQLETSETQLAKAQETLAKARERATAFELTSAKPALISAAAPGGERSPTPPAAASVDFEKQVKPILEKSCVSCHRSGNSRSGLALDSLASILEGGKTSGPAVLPRNSGESPLVLYLQGKKKPRMPFGSAPLADADIALIQEWIDQMPEEGPRVALHRAEAAVTLVEKQLASARANIPAVEARIAAEKAKLAEPADPQAEALAKKAQEAERQFQLLRAEENLWKAQQKLTEVLNAAKPGDDKSDKERDKKVAGARKELEAAQGALTQADKEYTPLGERYPKTSSGRRLALARWITSRENPLTARVAINHLWLRHFGKPIVPTVVNFGLNGKPATHPELLDWLASELMDNGWSMKPIHRLMVTSNTYRMQSSSPDAAFASRKLDPENQYLWRMNPRRMESEIVRDSLLSVAGQLDTTTMGGPDLDETQAEITPRRSLYFHHTPDSQAVFLKLFNAPDPTDCYKREESVVPQQALALANSKLSRKEARILTQTLSSRLAGKRDESAFINGAFEAVLGRLPNAKEAAESRNFLVEQAALYRNTEKLTPLPAMGSPSEIPPAKEPGLRARESLVHVLFNHNDFVTIR